MNQDTPKSLKKIVMFRSDGCTGIPDGAYRGCCDEHDFYYRFRGRFHWGAWCEAGRMMKNPSPVRRAHADRLLRGCVEEHEDKLFASFVWLAVRSLGWIWWWDIPTKFERYGWVFLVAIFGGLLAWII